MSESDPLPYFVAVGDNPHGGLIQKDMLGGWSASNWSGKLGVFPSATEAERAAQNAPKPPKGAKRGIKKPKPVPPEALTLSDVTWPILNGRGKRVGAVIRTPAGYAGWASAKVGEYRTQAEAQRATNAAILAEDAARAAARAARRRVREQFSDLLPPAPEADRRAAERLIAGPAEAPSPAEGEDGYCGVDPADVEPF